MESVLSRGLSPRGSCAVTRAVPLKDTSTNTFRVSQWPFSGNWCTQAGSIEVRKSFSETHHSALHCSHHTHWSTRCICPGCLYAYMCSHLISVGGHRTCTKLIQLDAYNTVFSFDASNCRISPCRPHRIHNVHGATYCDVTDNPVARCVCLSVTRLLCAKSAIRIEVMFGIGTLC